MKTKLKLNITCLILTLTVSQVFSQQNDAELNNSINFEKNKTYNEILHEAEKQNKFIFIDCYASWCVPCKKMDTLIFKSPEVYSYVNKHFISVKLNTDPKQNDTAVNEHWKLTAKLLKEKYHITSLPTYLFLSPKGELKHRGQGFLPPDAFIALANAALNPSKQYYSLIAEYNKGNRSKDLLSSIIKSAKSIGDNTVLRKAILDLYEISTEKHVFIKSNILILKQNERDSTINLILQSYKKDYINKIPLDSILTYDILNFYQLFPSIVSSEDIIITAIKKNKTQVNKAAKNNNFSDMLIGMVIQNEINTRLYANKIIITPNPNWQDIKKTIQGEFLDYKFDSIVRQNQIQFYYLTSNWEAYSKVVTEIVEIIAKKKPFEIKKSPFGDAWMINSYGWTIFRKCTDRKIIKKAINWLDIAISIEARAPNEQILDTKANLLYKLGKRRKAIKLEEYAIEVGKLEAERTGRVGVSFKQYYDIIKKMKEKVPTW